jgi:hypothetical protein
MKVLKKKALKSKNEKNKGIESLKKVKNTLLIFSSCVPSSPSISNCPMPGTFERSTLSLTILSQFSKLKHVGLSLSKNWMMKRMMMEKMTTV